MKILVTGSEGFIGSHLVEFLKAAGNEVNEGENYDQVYHLAAFSGSSTRKDPKMLRDNIESTLKVIEKYPDARILFTSSNEVNYLTSPDQTYAYSKQVCEYLLKLNHSNVVIARLGNVYGPRMRKEYMIYNAIERVRKTKKMFLHVDHPFDLRPYLYISDAVVGLWELMESQSNETVTIGSYAPLAVQAVYERIIKIMGKDITIMRDEDYEPISARHCDISRMREITGWFPFTSLNDGLKETIESFI